MLNSLSVIIINYQTPDLLTTAVESFRSFYPALNILIVDNGSKDHSLDCIKTMIAKDPATTTLLQFSENIFHGPAMHNAIEKSDSDFIFILDSDTVTMQGTFLEKMMDIFQTNEKIYAVGRLDHVDKRGFISHQNGIPAIRTFSMLLKREYYLRLHPFEHHGLPTLKNFTDAHRRGFTNIDFPIEEYIHHLGRGTAARFGYHLGIKSKIDFVLYKFGL